MVAGKGYTITAFATAEKPGEFKQITYEAPPLKDDEIYIKLLACGVCHTDTLYMGVPGTVLGHEPIGEIVEVGTSVKKFKKGDIVGYFYLRECCLNCRQCNSGEDMMCPDRVFFPDGNNNAYAHNVVCKDKFVFTIPKSMKPQEAAPLMCAGNTVFTALHKANIPASGRVAVVGIGGLGHLALQFARSWGYHVTAISHTPSKKEECLKFGAHDFMASKDFTPEYVASAPKFDLILDTVSVSIEWDSYLNLLDKNGAFYLLGLPDTPVTISAILPFVQSQKVLRGSLLGGRYMVDLMLEFADRHNIKPAVVEYPMTTDGIAKAIKDSDTVRYRAVLVNKE